MAAKYPKGSLMQAGDTGTATNFQTIPGCRSIGLSGMTAETLDSTAHDTPGNFRDFIQGLKEWGTFQFEMLWDSSLSLHQQLFNDFSQGTERYYQLLIKSQGATIGTFVFKGFVSKAPFTVPYDALLTMNVEITVRATPAPVLS